MTASFVRVDIALATYNGERFLAPFLDSLVDQTHPHIGLVVADDGSIDETTAILERYRDRLSICFLGSTRRGVVGNFERALSGCTADYIALADQDDIWKPDKIERLLARAQEVEASASSDHPIMVFADLALISENQEMITSSFFNATRKSIEARSVTDFALGNHAPGCSTLINRSLLDLALPFPQLTIHDWWVNLLAAAGGRVVACHERLVDYRQHAGNAIGVGSAVLADAAKARAALTKPFSFVTARIAAARKRAMEARAQLLVLRLRLEERGIAAAASYEAEQLTRFGMVDLIKAFAGARTGLRAVDLVLTLFFLNRLNRSAASAIEIQNVHRS